MGSSAPSPLISTPPAGEIITFYSYKGGTGRSMAVANIACLLSKRLARTSQRVLVMDWDLEAPGLHRFFSAKSDLPDFQSRPGVINYFDDLRKQLRAKSKIYEDMSAPQGWEVMEKVAPLDAYCIPDVVQGVDFMRAGNFGPEYAKLVGSFNWIEFFTKYGRVIRSFRELLARRFAFTLVDSRTGLTDVSGICTTLLPEKLVGVFTPNRQSLSGLCDLVKEALEYRRRSEDDFRPLSVFPLPSRVENAERDLREQWRKDYQSQFENLFRTALEISNCDLTQYFDDVLLPHVSYFAYGENIAILQERPDAISLSAAYRRFFDRLMNSSYAWEVERPDVIQKPTLVASTSAAIHPKYDAFLSYARSDKESVEQLEKQLRSLGVKTFFPHRDLTPGQEILTGITNAMAESKALLLFIGRNGGGPWQDQELAAILETCAKDPTRQIIPVLLPDAPSKESLTRLPNYLTSKTWFEFHTGFDSKSVSYLAWAITGVQPKSSNQLLTTARVAVGVLGAFVLVLGLIFAGRELFRRGYLGEIAEAKKVVQQKANDSDAHVALANALQHWGRTAAAMQEYLAALKLAPSNANAAHGISSSYEHLDPSHAISILSEAVQIAPNQAVLHRDLAGLLRVGDPKTAIEEQIKTIQLDPHDEVVDYYLGEMYEENASKDNDYAYRALQQYLIANKVANENHETYFAGLASEKIRRLSQTLKMQPYLWGIMLSADQQLEPAGEGAPSATFEVELAQQAELPNVALYQRPKWYGTVAQFQDEASAKSALAKIRGASGEAKPGVQQDALNAPSKEAPPFPAKWNAASLIDMGKWCPNAELVNLLGVNSKYVPVFNCPASASRAQTWSSRRHAA
jgi:tetratricopeptide (TPR) repeat protein